MDTQVLTGDGEVRAVMRWMTVTDRTWIACIVGSVGSRWLERCRH